MNFLKLHLIFEESISLRLSLMDQILCNLYGFEECTENFSNCTICYSNYLNLGVNYM
jgi:hypothetical protein